MPSVELPDSTAFQLLAVAIEGKSSTPFSEVLTGRALRALSVESTGMFATNLNISIFGDCWRNTSVAVDPLSLGLVSLIANHSVLGRSLLTADPSGAVETRCGLKPVSSTSNLGNAGGRHREIFYYSDEAIVPIIELFTNAGTVGRWSSCFGLAPTFDVWLCDPGAGLRDRVAGSERMCRFELVQIQGMG